MSFSSGQPLLTKWLEPNLFCINSPSLHFHPPAFIFSLVVVVLVWEQKNVCAPKNTITQRSILVGGGAVPKVWQVWVEFWRSFVAIRDPWSATLDIKISARIGYYGWKWESEANFLKMRKKVWYVETHYRAYSSILGYSLVIHLTSEGNFSAAHKNQLMIPWVSSFSAPSTPSKRLRVITGKCLS